MRLTHDSKLGSDSRSSIELLIGKSFKEAPNSLTGPSLRNFVDNSILLMFHVVCYFYVYSGWLHLNSKSLLLCCSTLPAYVTGNDSGNS
jgi:hypothetical protein